MLVRLTSRSSTRRAPGLRKPTKESFPPVETREHGTVIEAIGFDCDDTLWESETAFHESHARVRELLAEHAEAESFDRRLIEVERANLALYGYGAKAFTLSLVETAIELGGDSVGAAEIRALIEIGKDLLAHPVELLPGAREAVEAAAASGLTVLLITKGDLFHQESKIARSGLGDLVSSVEVIHEKDESTYGRVLARNRVEADRFVMVGNSLRSDVAPVLALGGWAAHVPFELTWELEHLDDDTPVTSSPRFRAMTSLEEVTPWITELRGRRSR